MCATDDSIRVLHVDDELEFADLTATYLEREDDRFRVETASSVGDALEELTPAVDCVVSDYDMSGRSGLDLLELVRSEYPELPFILFTGKGSEEIASEAISAGVTDYLRKEVGTDQYTVLSNRIENAVDRFRSRHALATERDRFASLFENTTDCIAYCEYDGSKPIIRAVNEKFESVFGYRSETIEGTCLDDVVASGELHDEAAKLSKRVKTGDVIEEEIERETADGRRTFYHRAVPVDETNVTSQFAIYTDITEQKEREQELEQIRDRIEFALDAADSVLFSVDTETTAVTRWGPVERVYGISPETITTVGEYISRVVHPDDEAFVREKDDEIIGSVGEVITYECRTNPENGDVRWLRTTGYTKVTPDGTSHRYIGLATDITEQKQRESELQHERDQLDEFAGVVSHDLRNPLGVIDGRLELLEADCDSSHIDPMRDATDRMYRLIDDVLWLAREGRTVGSTEPVDLREMADAAWAIVADGHEWAELRHTESMEQIVIEADENRLRQLLENLLRNAIEHGSTSPRSQAPEDAEEHGSNAPNVHEDVVDRDVDVTVRIERIDGGFAIEDDGIGIDPEDRDRVFDVGYSTADGGSGFGLRIVEQIVDAHGWSLQVTDSDSGGARFEITDVTVIT